MILAVAGGKGGVGTSTVAHNLAAEIDAVVVDADLTMADLPCRRGPDLHDVLAGRADPVEAVDESGPVALLPCGRSLAGARSADPTRLAAVLEDVAGEYGPVVVDCPAGTDGGPGIALLAADACVLVTAPDPVAIAGTLRVRSLARQVDTGVTCVALNRAPDDSHHVERILGAPTVAIPDSDAVRRATRAGFPVRSVAPGDAATTGFAALADTVQSCSRS